MKKQLNWLICCVLIVLVACSTSQENQQGELELNEGSVAASNTGKIDDFDDNWNNLGTQQFSQQVAADENNSQLAEENEYATNGYENNVEEEYANYEENENIGQYAAEEDSYNNSAAQDSGNNLLASISNNPVDTANALPVENAGAFLDAPANVTEPPVVQNPVPMQPAPVANVPVATPVPVSPFDGPAIHELTWVGFDYNKDAQQIRVDLKTKGEPTYQVLQEANQAGQPELVIRYIRTKLRRKIRRDIDASEFRSPIAYIRMRQSGNKTDVVLTLRSQIKPKIFAKNGDIVLTVDIPDEYMGANPLGEGDVVAQAQVINAADLMPQYETGSDLPIEMEKAVVKAYVPTIASDALQSVPVDGGEVIDPATLPQADAQLPPLEPAIAAMPDVLPMPQDVSTEVVSQPEPVLPPVVHQDVKDLPVPGQKQDVANPADQAVGPKVAANAVDTMNDVAIPDVNAFEFETPSEPAQTDIFSGTGDYSFGESTPPAASEDYEEYDYEEYEEYEDGYDSFEEFEENLDNFDDYESEDNIDKFEVRLIPTMPKTWKARLDIASTSAIEVIGTYDVIAVAQDGLENPVEDFGAVNTGNFGNITNEVLNELPLDNAVPVDNTMAPVEEFPVDGAIPANAAVQPAMDPAPLAPVSEQPYAQDVQGNVVADPYEVEGQDQATPPAGSLGGREVSLDFRAAPLSDVVRVLSEESGINFVMPDSLNDKKVTVTLQNVPFNDALKGVLNAHGLGLIEISPNLVRIDTNENLTKTREQDEKRKEVETRLQPTKVLTYPLSYYDAEAAKGMLQQLLSGLAKADTRITVDFDKRTNTVIVNATPNTLNMAKTLLERLDRETPQIKISSRIVEVTQKFGEMLGLNWNFSSLNDQGRGLGFGNLVFPNYALSRFSVDTGGLKPDVAGKPRFTLGSLNNSLALDIALAMEESRGTTEILQSSDMMVEDNRKAKIVAGSRDYMKPAIPAGVTLETPPDYKEINYDLLVEVTPRATADGSIRMEFNIKSETPGASSIPGAEAAVDKREMNTVVIKKNGETAVIGGVYTTDKTDTVTGVPFFSSIPIIGALFRGSDTRETKKELLVMVTPSIVTNVSGMGLSSSSNLGGSNFGAPTNNYGNSQEFNWEQTGTNEGYSNNTYSNNAATANYGNTGNYSNSYSQSDYSEGNTNSEYNAQNYNQYSDESYDQFNEQSEQADTQQANFNGEDDNGLF